MSENEAELSEVKLDPSKISLLSYEDKLKYCSVIAQPLAHQKLCKRLCRLIRKSWKRKSMFNGIKSVQKAIRKGNKGIVIFAGDVSPVDVISHLPIYCEDNNIPYVYVPLKYDIAQAMGVYRPCLAVLITRHEDFGDLFDKCKDEINNLEINF